MQKLKIILSFIILLVFADARAQLSEQAITDYIARYKDLAITEMLRSGVPASITLAQGIHETEAGQSKLVLASNNHFGIKCKSNWAGESVTHTDDAPNECFRKYASADDSYRDHSDFLRTSPRYSSLFNLDPEDYEGWAYGLKKAGYATNPRYPQIIIKLITDYHLNDYTLLALGKIKDTEILATTKEEDPGETETAIPPVQYPDGEFKINETRVVYVKKGTSFLSVAQQYDIPLARLFEFNEMEQKDIAGKDQLVFLQRKRKTGNNQTHIVRKGESLYDIAQSEAIRFSSLLEYNYLSKGMQPAAGEILYLHTKAPAMPKILSSVSTDKTGVQHPLTGMLREGDKSSAAN